MRYKTFNTSFGEVKVENAIFDLYELRKQYGILIHVPNVKNPIKEAGFTKEDITTEDLEIIIEFNM